MRLLLASENRGKLLEMQTLLPKLSLVLPSELGFSSEVLETGDTFEENARLKAENACRISGLPAVADDSGLCVDALSGEPGVRSRRFGGDIDDMRKCSLLIEKMKNMEHRSAKFVSVIVCRFPNGDELVSHGECCGELTHELRGNGGFGYDPVFYVPQLGKTMAELTPDEKNAISHRGAAIREFTKKLESYLRRTDADK